MCAQRIVCTHAKQADIAALPLESDCMFEFPCRKLDERTYQFTLEAHGQSTSFEEVVQLWQDQQEFVSAFGNVLRAAPFAAFRWETPPVTVNSMGRRFEFVIVDSPELRMRADGSSFRTYLDDAQSDSAVVFNNLGGDAVLVVPTRSADGSEYAHLAEFVRGASPRQNLILWQSGME